MQPIPLYKVYDENDVYLGVLNDVVSDLSIPNEINTPGSYITLELARNADSIEEVFDSFITEDGDELITEDGFTFVALTGLRNKIGPSSLINHNNKVVVSASLGTDPIFITEDDDEFITESGDNFIASQFGDAQDLFIGFISDISINWGGNENTVITVASYGYDLDQYIIQSGSNTTVAFNSQDPGQIVRTTLTTFAGLAGTINYNNSTVDLTSSVVSYTFNTNTYREMLDIALKLSPGNWYYYLDQGNNFIYFKPRPAEPAHTFLLGKHFESLDLNSTILEAVNDSVFSGGEVSGDNIFVRETVTPAVGTRRALRRQSDNRVTLPSSAEIIAEGEVETYNKIIWRSQLTVLAADYPISTIRPGDIIRFRNFDSFVDELELQVVRLVLELDRIHLEVGTMTPKVSKRLEDIKRNLFLQESQNNPSAPA